MNVDTTGIQTKVNKLHARIGEMSKTVTLAESEAAAEKIRDLMDGLTPESDHTELRTQFNELASKAVLSNLYNEVRMLQVTLAADLMKVDTDFVVTDTETLTSPAGFHPDERVFIQTRVAIHTNDLNKVPSSNVKLFAHKV